MSTRQLRISSQTEIRKRINEFVGRKINIVLNDKTVLLTFVESATDNVLAVKNMRLEKINIPIASISEVYLDTEE